MPQRLQTSGNGGGHQSRRIYIPVWRSADRKRYRGAGIIRAILPKIRFRPGSLAGACRGTAKGHGGTRTPDPLVAGRRARTEMTDPASALVLGGARSGKSAFAESLVRA